MQKYHLYSTKYNEIFIPMTVSEIGYRTVSVVRSELYLQKSA